MRGKRLGVLALAAVLLASAGPARAADREAVNRAIDLGARSLRGSQLANGTWPHDQIGLTALCALTLLECDVPVDDPAIRKAADAVRLAAVDADQTYSIALCILFLDRLGEPVDVALIESLAVRLLAGQGSLGDWGYTCPRVGGVEEHRRLTTILKQPAGRGHDKAPPRSPDDPPRTAKDLPKIVQTHLESVRKHRAAMGAAVGAGDHSNTQFAVLGLWVARRHGLPVDNALGEADRHFRRCINIDGGWGYVPLPAGAPAAAVAAMPGRASTPSMTCSGLLGVGLAYGAWNEASLRTDAKGKEPAKPGAPAGKAGDPSKDKVVVDAFRLLGTWIDAMAQGGKVPRVNTANGKFYYFLWSLERVAVAYDVETFGKTGWYDWGTEVLLANQGPDGGWNNGGFPGAPDTCFALFFLRRANLVKDLSRALKSQMKEGLQAALQQGGFGGASLVKGARKPFFDGSTTEEPGGKSGEDAQVARLGKQLASASGEEQEQLLKKLRDGKGAAYTEALASAIPNLEGDGLKKAREALAERLSRMNSETLGVKLEDDAPEVRRAAALAVAMKEDKAHVFKLIELLGDREATVGHAARAALKSLSGKDFGPAKDASSEERAAAILQWKEWYRKEFQEGK